MMFVWTGKHVKPEVNFSSHSSSSLRRKRFFHGRGVSNRSHTLKEVTAKEYNEVGDQFRSNDDGEPPGTAGKPILSAMETSALDRVMVVVIRCFGGIILGTGGLVRWAYGGVASECLRNAPTTLVKSRVRMGLEIPFDLLGVLYHQGLILAKGNLYLKALSKLVLQQPDCMVILVLVFALYELWYFQDSHCVQQIKDRASCSNLTEDGHVECDASIMDGESGAFGDVGALSGVLLFLLNIPCIFDPRGRANICGDWLLGSSVEAVALSAMSIPYHIPYYFQSSGMCTDEFDVVLDTEFQPFKGHDIGHAVYSACLDPMALVKFIQVLLSLIMFLCLSIAC